MVKKKSAILLLVFGIFLALILYINLTSAVYFEGKNFEDYKVINYSSVFVASELSTSCSWKPDKIDNGYKDCDIEIIVWNKKNIAISIDMVKDKFDFKITKSIKDKVDFYYSTDFEIYEEKRANNTNTLVVNGSSVRGAPYSVSKIRFSNWKPIDNLTKSIPSNKIVGIKAEFEIPKYSRASWNFTYTPLNMLLDPDVSACGNLNTADSIYTLTQSINTTGTCFTISANNVTLNCQGYTINYSTDGILGYGVYSSGYNFTTVKNCVIKEGNITTLDKYAYAIYFTNSSSGTIVNNTIVTMGNFSYGINLDSSSNSNITSNTITTLGGSGFGIQLISGSNSNILNNNTITAFNGSGFGIYLRSSSNSNITSNTINTFGDLGFGIHLYEYANSNMITSNIVATFGNGQSYPLRLDLNSSGNILNRNVVNSSGINNSYGLRLEAGSNSNIFLNNTVTTFGNNGSGIYFRTGSNNNSFSGTNVKTNGPTGYSIYIFNANHNFTISDSTLNSSLVQDFYVSNIVTGGEWNFTNVTRSDGSSPIAINWALGGEGILNMRWYLDAHSNYTNGTAISNVNVSSWDVNNAIQFSKFTDISGRIPRQTILEYRRNDSTGLGTTVNYYSNYTFNASLTGSSTQSQSWNMSINRLLMFSFDKIAPNLTMVYPPNSTNSTNTHLNVNYTVSDANLQSCWYSNNSGLTNHSITCGNNLTTLTWDEGNNIVYIYAKDESSNLNFTSVSFFIDSIPPAINIISPLNTSYVYGSTKIDFNVSTNENTRWCGFNLDGRFFAPFVTMTKINETYFNYTKIVTDFMYHSVEFECNDTIGNINSTSVNFIIDTSYTTSSTGVIFLPAPSVPSSTGLGGTAGNYSTVVNIKAVALIKYINDTRSDYTDTQRAVIYAVIKSYTDLYKTGFFLNSNQTEEILSILGNKDVNLNENELSMWFEQFKNNQVEEVTVDSESFDRYGLIRITSVEVVKLELNPKRIFSIWFYSPNRNFSLDIKSNQDLISCNITLSNKKDLKCDLSGNSTAKIIYDGRLDLWYDVIEGEATIQGIYGLYERVPINIKVYNFLGSWNKIPILVIIPLGFIVFLTSVFKIKSIIIKKRGKKDE